MAHFAQLDQNNVVTSVIVVNNEQVGNLPFPESEPVGVEFCRSLYGQDTNWAQTSYNSNFRYNYAGIGFTFDKNSGANGAFIPQQPYPSWVLDNTTYQWKAPVPYPNDGQMYTWNEETKSWDLVETPTPQ